MKLALKLSIITVYLMVLGCKKEETVAFTGSKFANKSQVLVCKDLDMTLYNEALYSFENDLLTYYQRDSSNVRGAYTVFLREVSSNQIDLENMVSLHTLNVLGALKNKSEIWNNNNELNYKAPFFTCLIDNLIAQDYAKTLRALIETNSLRSDILAAPLKKYIKMADRDKYLATFIAFNMYYSKIVHLDSQAVKEKSAVEESLVNP